MSKDLPNLYRILSAMVRSVQIPVTIKIRTGWDSQTRNATEVIRVASDAGVNWVAIHGRTRAQGYSGEADWDFISEVKAKSPLPIIGNGDLTTPHLAVQRLIQSGVDAVMIGRGVLRNPFIFRDATQLWRSTLDPSLNPPEERTPERYCQELLIFLGKQRVLLEGHFSERQALLHSRKFLAWYASGFPGCHEFRRNVFTILSGEELWQSARDFFERAIVERKRSLDFLSEPFLMGGHG